MVTNTTDFTANYNALVDLRDSLAPGERAVIEQVPRHLAVGYRQFINKVPGVVVHAVEYGETATIHLHRYR